MRVGINARFLLIPYSGIGQHTKHLVMALSKIDRRNEYLLFVPKRLPKNLQFKLPKNFKIKVVPELSFGTAGMKKSWWEQVQVPKAMRQHKVEVAHFPYPANPRFNFKIPSLVTIHDTIPWTNKSYHNGLLSKLYHKNSQAAALKATKLITVSKDAQSKIAQQLKIPAAAVDVIYNAADPIYQKPASAKLKQDLKTKYKLNNPYFIYVGGYDQRKNVERLVKGFMSKIAPKLKVDLLLVGGKLHNSKLYQGFDNLQATNKKARMNSIKGKGTIISTGFVSSDELNGLYEDALGFVNFSQQEGFNLGIAEASCKQIPLILSDIPVHREISRNKALFANPNNIQDIGKTLAKFLRQNPKIKAKLPYNWNESAKQTRALYQSLTK